MGFAHNKNEYDVQPAQQEHVRQIAELYVRSWKSTYEGLLIQSYLDSLNVREQEQNWSGYMKQPDHGIYVAASEGRVLGFAAFRPFERMENTIYIDSLHVDGSARKQGVGTALLEAVKACGFIQGFSHMALQVVQGNDNAHNFYLHRGGEHRSNKISTFTGADSVSEMFVWDFIPPEVGTVLNALEAAGFEAYIVGGCVRDMIMGRKPHDFDVTTSARPEQVRAVFEGLLLADGRSAKVFDTGIKHGTVTVLTGGEPVEVTTFRVEGTYSDGRHPDSVEFTGSLQEDLARRDFTMNAIAWSPAGGLKDYFGGSEDISSGIIRAVGNPDQRFKEDALRILRAIRFASVLGFEIGPETGRAMTANKHLLEKISAERIREELTKLLTGSGAGCIILKYADIIGQAIPELMTIKGFDQRNPHHIYDVLEHSAVCVDCIRPEPHLRWAALLHDAGKPETFTTDDSGTGHFYGHAARSEEITRAVMHRLRFDNETLNRVTDLVKYHDLQIELTPKAVKRALNKLGEETLRDLILLKRADNLSQSPEFAGRQQYYNQLEDLLTLISEEKQCFSLKDLAVNGNDLIVAGITDGRTIGQTLKEALEEVIDGRLANEKEILLSWILERRV
ncbi:MAG: GNAT family N-acetyltransferase [Firmicutes bacterium]|nr:GNAT family N-acetyltransferase [Bacillota bacterium]